MPLLQATVSQHLKKLKEAGRTVLDLGSGAGLDTFVSPKQVGESGQLIGVDMTADLQ